MHGSLEEGGGIGEAEVHYSWYIGALRGFECCFVLVFFSDVDIVIAPADVEL